VQRTVLGVLIVLLLGGLAAAFGLFGRPPADLQGPMLPAAPEQARTEGGPMVSGTLPEAAGPSRAEAETPAPAVTTGVANVVVNAVRSGSGAPVPDLAVSLWSGDGDPWAADQSAHTDADGRAHFEVAEGPCEVAGATGGSARGEARTGEVLELHLVVPQGYRISGTVVDRTGMPVAAAQIGVSWTGNPNRDVTVTSSDGQGAFAITDVSGPRLLAVRHAQYAASPQQYVSGKPGEECRVRFVLLAEPSAIDGIVVDRSGTPVAGALVLIGTDRTGMRLYETSAPSLARADAQGHFRARGLQTGTNPLAARARGLGSWQGTVDVLPGRATEVRIVLPPSAMLTGTVRDTAGEPVAGALLWTGVRHAFLSQSGTSDAQGNYRLDDLAAGICKVTAFADAERTVSESMELAQPQSRWNPVLPSARSAPSLRGRVIDHLGQPVSGCRIVAWDEGTQSRGQSARTDPAGRFLITGLWAGASLQVRAWRQTAAVNDFPDAVKNGVRLEDGELELRLLDPVAESGLLRLRAVDVEGRGKQVDVNLWHEELSVWCAQRTAADGRLELRLPAGMLSLDVQSAEHPRVRLLRQELRAGSVLDLGDIGLQPGCCVFGHLRSAAGEVPATATVRVLDGFSEAGPASYQSGSFRSAALKPGDYTLLVQAPGFASARVPVSLQSGEQREQDVQLQIGTIRRLRVTVPAGADAGAWISVRLFDEVNQLRAWFTLPVDQNVGEGALWLSEGSYRLLAAGARGWRGDAALQVQGRTEVPPLEIALQQQR
jgi:protocatechuate 3,4-dioxygenase beta subunit